MSKLSETMDHYIDWNDGRLEGNSEYFIRKYLEHWFEYEVVIKGKTIGLDDVDRDTKGYWSAYGDNIYGGNADEASAYYFFQLEEDAVAFKLKWL